MKDKDHLAVFRLAAAEFKEVPDKTVRAWFALTEPLVSKRVFGSLHGQALAFLTAHRMKLAGAGDAGDPHTSEQMDKIGKLKRAGVASISEGKVSVSLSHSAAEAELASTEYGAQFLALRRKRIAPIVSAAERRA